MYFTNISALKRKWLFHNSVCGFILTSTKNFMMTMLIFQNYGNDILAICCFRLYNMTSLLGVLWFLVWYGETE